MLRVEVNKKEAAQANNGALPYQFEQQESQHSRKLLVIGQNGKGIADSMGDLSYKHLQLESVNEAVQFLEKTSIYPNELPTAIICDAQLSDGFAFDLFKQIQGNHFVSIIPFIVISKEQNDTLRKKARETGIDDCYFGSVNAEDLHTRISFLKQFKSEKKRLSFNNEMLFENRISLMKRVIDIAIAGTALLLLSPILLLVMIIIRLESKGSVIYTSKRVGTGYNIFDLYKFRSMRQGADVELKKLAHLNQYKDDNSNKAGMQFFKLENDPRVTLFGKFLRASSIDEIPQLFNIIKGDMSLVGNRPLPLYEAEQLTRDVWAKRFLAPAGLTGLWQVSRRGSEEMSVSERVILDNTYADYHSLFLDFKIIVKTFPALVSKIHS